jgi:hypothetical protein
MTTRRLLTGGFVVIAAGLAGLGGVYAYWQTAAPERTCASCHEIESAHEMWTQSPHRGVACAACHGTAFSSGLHSLTQQGRTVLAHFAGQADDKVRLTEPQVLAVMDRCRACHAREYADWLSGGHSASYADIFLDERHNEREQPTESCLRCHGMFFDGTIAQVVTPLDAVGPWQLADPKRVSLPTIPCLACHQVHVEGAPAVRPDYADPTTIAARRAPRAAAVGFYDRDERQHFPASALPTLELSDRGAPIRVATDPRQRICLQCHAPNVFRQAGSSDDRTPRGVHEGLSCSACHAAHSNDASASCANCHPQLSNCGLAVDTMETTYADPASPNNIHFVACIDCHEREFLDTLTDTD